MALSDQKLRSNQAINRTYAHDATGVDLRWVLKSQSCEPPSLVTGEKSGRSTLRRSMSWLWTVRCGRGVEWHNDFRASAFDEK